MEHYTLKNDQKLRVNFAIFKNQTGARLEGAEWSPDQERNVWIFIKLPNFSLSVIYDMFHYLKFWMLYKFVLIKIFVLIDVEMSFLKNIVFHCNNLKLASKGQDFHQ